MLELTSVETRILGCLLEKERTTPENYPLSLNSLTSACNQTTAREPVVSFDEKTVENGANSLREKKLATVVFGAGSRVQKYRHNLLDHFDLDRREIALLCVLLLRGAQTPGELRSRTERLHSFSSLAEVEACLDELARGDAPLVRMLPARPGQKEKRFVQLLSGEPESEPTNLSQTQSGDISSASAIAREAAPAKDSRAAPHFEQRSERIESLEKEVANLKAEVARLREDFAEFRRQFE